jgi:saccharopine dehydrogenase-like NADP-dependent oxidoreductase
LTKQLLAQSTAQKTPVQINVTSRTPSALKSNAFWNSVGAQSGPEFLALDITNASAVDAAVASSDVVVNLVGVMEPSATRSFHSVHVTVCIPSSD